MLTSVAFGSTVALNAILSASVVLLEISYIIPISLVLFRGTKVLEPAGYPVRVLTLGKFRREQRCIGEDPLADLQRLSMPLLPSSPL